MREIRGEAKTIRQLLSGTRYSIDYYQREYRWQPKQVRELVDDLTEKFLQDYKTTDERDAVQSYDIWVSVRASRTDPWGAPTPVKEVNTVKGEAAPSVTGDGLVMAFHSNRASADSDIYLTTRATTSAAWGTPMPVPAVNSTVDDFDPGLSSDGLQLYVTSARIGGQGSRDLWLARRASRSSDFGPAVNVTELNTDGLDEAPWVADDDRLIVFSHMPKNGLFGIYEATR